MQKRAYLDAEIARERVAIAGREPVTACSKCGPTSGLLSRQERIVSLFSDRARLDLKLATK